MAARHHEADVDVPGRHLRLSAGPGQKKSIVSSKQVAFPALAPKTSAYRVVVRIAEAGNQRVRAYVDAIVLQRGKIQSVLLFTSLGRPIDRRSEPPWPP